MGMDVSMRKILVLGATGFVGRALVRHLSVQGAHVIGAGRNASPNERLGVPWRRCDVLDPHTLGPALEGIEVAYYLVHSMGDGRGDYAKLEQQGAAAFADAAAKAGVRRIVYLGGVKPRGHVSEHLRSRLAVGETLRAGTVSAVELRASMVVGHESASWQIVRDLAMRLPAMVLPTWLSSRSRPVALDDVIAALTAAADMKLEHSAWFDIPGPDTLSGRDILERIAGLRGRRIFAIDVPMLTPRLSALWLRLVTRGDYGITKELVLGLGDDLLPEDDRFWSTIGHTELVGFDEAARRALAYEARNPDTRPLFARFEEKLVDTFAPRKERA